MRAGELRHRCDIIRPEEDDAPLATIDEGVPVKIDVLPLAFQQREHLAAGGLQTQTIYTLTCRYRTDIKANMKIVERCCTQRAFQIVAIIPSDRRDALDMTCVTNG